MDDSAVKETRQILRRVQDHLFQAHLALGVTHESVGFVDVMVHPTNAAPILNYVTPRRNTAWVSGKFVQQGIDRLRALKRAARVEYIEGLYPPQFARALSDLGLESERETRIMAYALVELNQKVPRTSSPAGVRSEAAKEGQGSKLWRSVWQDAGYHVSTLGIEPVTVGQTLPATLVDTLMLRDKTPIGIARVGINPATRSAHIVALAIRQSERTERLTKVLLTAAMRAALTRGCTLVFAAGEGESDQALMSKLGFVDVGTMVCYAARSERANEAHPHDGILQPVLARRRPNRR